MAASIRGILVASSGGWAISHWRKIGEGLNDLERTLTSQTFRERRCNPSRVGDTHQKVMRRKIRFVRDAKGMDR